jgi:hypothetical protein
MEAFWAATNSVADGPWDSFGADVWGSDGDKVATCWGNLGLDPATEDEDVAQYVATFSPEVVRRILDYAAWAEVEAEALRRENELLRNELLSEIFDDTLSMSARTDRSPRPCTCGIIQVYGGTPSGVLHSNGCPAAKMKDDQDG